MKTGDLISWKKTQHKRDPKTGVVYHQTYVTSEDIGIILAQRSPDSYDVMFSNGEIAKGVWCKEMEVINESR